MSGNCCSACFGIVIGEETVGTTTHSKVEKEEKLKGVLKCESFCGVKERKIILPASRF